MGIFDFLSNPSVLNAIGTGVQIAGSVKTAQEQKDYGAESKAAAQLQADQMRQSAGASQAAAQRAAYIEERNARLRMSDALASAAASGGGASDPTVVNIIAGIAKEGAYRAQVALYQGDDRARVLQMQARATELSGASKQDSADSAAFGSYLGAGTNFLKGMAKDASLYQRFAGDGPKVGATTGGASTDSWWAYDGVDAY